MSERALQGILGNVSYKDFTDRQSGEPIKLYSFQIEGSNQWFRTGRAPVPFGVGQAVKFVADGQNVNVRTMAAAASDVRSSVPVSPPAAASPSGPVRATRPVVGKDEYWANKEAHDKEKEARFQAVNEPRMAVSVAVTAAAQVVASAFTTGALDFGKATKAKKLGMISDAVKEVAHELAQFIHNAPAVIATKLPEKNNNEVEQETNE